MWDGTTKEIEDPFESVVFVENRHMCYFDSSIQLKKYYGDTWVIMLIIYDLLLTVLQFDSWEALILFMRGLSIK